MQIRDLNEELQDDGLTDSARKKREIQIKHLVGRLPDTPGPFVQFVQSYLVEHYVEKVCVY